MCDCIYADTLEIKSQSGVAQIPYCNLKNRGFTTLPENCEYKNKDVSEMKICRNCSNFLGGGDWGLSCKANYYTITQPMNVACEQFDKIKED